MRFLPDDFDSNSFAKWFEQWLLKQGEDDVEEAMITASDIATGGADAGWPDLSYYEDTLNLYAEHKEAIWEIVADYAEGEDTTVLGLLQNKWEINTADELENNMVWAAVEILASATVERAEELETEPEEPTED